MLALLPQCKSIAIEMTLDPGVDMFVMLTILMVWSMHLLTFRTSMFQCLQNGNIMMISWRSARSFVILVNIYLMDLWPMLQVAKLKSICFSFGVDLTVRISVTISSLMMTKYMTLEIKNTIREIIHYFQNFRKSTESTLGEEVN